MQAGALHVLQHSKAEVSATPFSPAENIDLSSHLDICVFTRHCCVGICENYLCLAQNSVYREQITAASQSLEVLEHPAARWGSVDGIIENTNHKKLLFSWNHTSTVWQQWLGNKNSNTCAYTAYIHTCTGTPGFSFCFHFVLRKNLGCLETLISFLWNLVKHRNLIMKSCYPHLLEPHHH